MNMTHDFNSAAGIRAVASHLECLADAAELFPPGPDTPPQPSRVHVGPLRLRPEPAPLRTAAKMLRKRAVEAARPRSGVWQVPRPEQDPQGARGSGVMKLDAVKVYGSPEAGLAAIESQLEAQAADMDPAAVKRCQDAANLLRLHLDRIAEEAAAVAAFVALGQRIGRAKHPEKGAIIPEGAEVVDRCGRLGKVTGHRGMKNGEVVHAITYRHIRRHGSLERIKKPHAVKAESRYDFYVLPPVIE